MILPDNETKIELLNNEAIATTIINFSCRTSYNMNIRWLTPSNRTLVFK
jgi:hypothetical protein